MPLYGTGTAGGGRMDFSTGSAGGTMTNPYLTGGGDGGGGGGRGPGDMFSALLADPTIKSMVELKKKKGALELERGAEDIASSREGRALAREKAKMEKEAAAQARRDAEQARRDAAAEKQRAAAQERADFMAYSAGKQQYASPRSWIGGDRADAATIAAMDWARIKRGGPVV